MSKAIRSSIVAASLEENFDPILALKVVLLALPAHRRGETLKRRLDLFFAGDVKGLLSVLRDAASKAHSLRKTPQRAATQTGPYPPAMAALAAGCPGKALRKLDRGSLVEPTPAVIERMRTLHPQEHRPQPPTAALPTTQPLTSRAVITTLRAMRLSGPGPSGIRAEHLLMAFERRNITSLLRVLCPPLSSARLCPPLAGRCAPYCSA